MGARTSEGDPEYNVGTRLLQAWHDTGCILNGESLGLASLLMERKRGGREGREEASEVMRCALTRWLLCPLPEDPTQYDSYILGRALVAQGRGRRRPKPHPPTGSRSQSSWSSLRPGFSENKGAFDVTTESKSWNCLTMTPKYHNPSWVLTLNREQLLVLITEFAKDDRNLWLVGWFFQ